MTVLILLSACKLQEVTIPLGSEVVVVQGVLTLDTAAAAQYIVVERSLTGTMVIPDQDSLRGPPRPPLPISGASVVVTRDDGDSAAFAEIPDTLGVYRLPRAVAQGFLAAGRVYRLRVATPDGRVVTGRTRMPDLPVVTGIPADGAVFDRDRDTLAVTWSGAAGTKGVFIQVRPRDLRRRLTLILFTDSTSFRVSGRLPLPFEEDTLPPWVWVAGTRQTFTVAAMDTSFFNFFRTANDPFTGSGFINGVEGGLGVFGSMAPVNRTYVVRGEVDHPYEGRYQLDYTPSNGGRAFTAELDVYVNRDRPAPALVNAIGTVTQGYFSGGQALEAAGRISAAGALHLWVIDTETGAEQPAILLVGGFDPAGAANGTVQDRDGATVGTYTLTREAGDR
ncbi:MAG: DUF4249 family protein [Gemmatimonadetes bacterium]|nr:DUF4249 family protein [Gemmatimonadota bacterium]